MDEILRSPITVFVILAILYFAVPEKYHHSFSSSILNPVTMRRVHYQCQTDTMRVDAFLKQAESLQSDSGFAAFLITEEVKQCFGTTDFFIDTLEKSHQFVLPTEFSRKGNCPELLHIKLRGTITKSVVSSERTV